MPHAHRDKGFFTDSAEPTTDRATVPTIRLEPSRGWTSLRLHEVWAARELLYVLVRRDLAVWYKQTVLGAAWAILQPLVTMVVFSVFFGRLAGVPSDGAPYPVFSFAGLLPWTFFANGVSLGANALVNNPDLIRKIYFPRLIMPTAAVMVGLVDLACALGVRVGVWVVYGVGPTPRLLWLPAFVVLAAATTLGVAFFLSAMNVQFRDVRYALPFLLQTWLFLTPVAYPSSLVPKPWLTLYGLNPMVGVVEGFRWSLLGTGTAPGPMSLVSGIAGAVLLVVGTVYFRRMERRFADDI